MVWIKPSSEDFEFTCVEWRNFERENVQEKLDRLVDEGWEIDGEEHCKAGMVVDLYWQQLRRPLR